MLDKIRIKFFMRNFISVGAFMCESRDLFTLDEFNISEFDTRSDTFYFEHPRGTERKNGELGKI